MPPEMIKRMRRPLSTPSTVAQRKLVRTLSTRPAPAQGRARPPLSSNPEGEGDGDEGADGEPERQRQRVARILAALDEKRDGIGIEPHAALGELRGQALEVAQQRRQAVEERGRLGRRVEA